MTNEEIADIVKLYAQLYELHGGNPFKIKSYNNASFKINKSMLPLDGKSSEELEQIEGIGKSLGAKICEICATGSFEELNDLLQSTPEGVVAMMQIKGLGPKKIHIIWKELGIESVGELIYACNENRLAQAKGFGLKTQEAVLKSIEFAMANSHKYHYASVEDIATAMLGELKKLQGVFNASFTGELRRKMEILEQLDFIVGGESVESLKNILLSSRLLLETESYDNIVKGKLNGIPVQIWLSANEEYEWNLFFSTGSEAHIVQLRNRPAGLNTAATEEEIYKGAGLTYILPELREGTREIELASANALPKLIEVSDLKGSLHNHSSWSDGLNTLEEMAIACRDMGLEYLGICDHSQSAFYASGLKPDRVMQQWAEIETLNKKLAPFHIFKGIESDILNNGSLDYEEDILKQFDFVVASIHSNLKMSGEKAMGRLLKAIENPYTTVLGHPTGRLLLVRGGYPVDHEKMIDACVANGVIIELNAHPYRLDMDWRWIDHALNKGVKISINPDAHNTGGFHDMHYGVCVARKGFLTKEMCFNAMDREEISAYFAKRKS